MIVLVFIGIHYMRHWNDYRRWESKEEEREDERDGLKNCGYKCTRRRMDFTMLYLTEITWRQMVSLMAMLRHGIGEIDSENWII